MSECEVLGFEYVEDMVAVRCKNEHRTVPN